MWVVLWAAPLCAVGFKYTYEDAFNNTDKNLNSSWPYGGREIDPKFTPRADNVSVCNEQLHPCQPITFELANIGDCEQFILHPETQNKYELNRMASNYIPLDGYLRSKAKRVEENGNILDLANVSANLFAGKYNYENNRFSNDTGLLYKPSTVFDTNFASAAGNRDILLNNTGPGLEGMLSEIYPTCEEQNRWFNSLPFWASDKAIIPVCMYTLSISQKTDTRLKKPSKTDPTKTLTEIRPFGLESAKEAVTASRKADRCPTPDFSALNDANFDVFCKDPPGNTVVLPGRCAMFDTNFLFRHKSTERVFQWSKVDANRTKWALTVYGRSQCDPQYGGKLVSFEDDNELKVPAPGDKPLNTDFFFYGYTVDNYGDNPETDLPVNSNLFRTDVCGIQKPIMAGTKLNLPLETFMQWSDTNTGNPNPLYFFNSRADWEDGSPAGLTGADAEEGVTCQRFEGPFPDGFINVDRVKTFLPRIKKSALRVSDRALEWASTNTDKNLTHDDIQQLHGLFDAHATSAIPTLKSTDTISKYLTFAQEFNLFEIIQNELSEGKVSLKDITPSHGVKDLTNDVLKNSSASEISVAALLLLMTYSPSSIDSYQINDNIRDKSMNAYNYKPKDKISKWFATHGQSLAAETHVKKEYDPITHRLSASLGALNEYPQLLPDSWSYNKDRGGAALNWNTYHGIPSLVFQPGNVTFESLFGDAAEKLENTLNTKLKEPLDAQTYNIFACDQDHMTLPSSMKHIKSSCPLLDFDATVNPTFKGQQKQYCLGALTFLGPTYETKAKCSNNSAYAVSTPCHNPPYSSANGCGATDVTFQGGINPTRQSCNSRYIESTDSGDTSLYAHATGDLSIEPCKYPLRYDDSTKKGLDEPTVYRDLTMAATPLPNDCDKSAYAKLILNDNDPDFDIDEGMNRFLVDDHCNNPVANGVSAQQLLYCKFYKSNFFNKNGYSTKTPCPANDPDFSNYNTRMTVGVGDGAGIGAGMIRFCIATVRKRTDNLNHHGGFRELSLSVLGKLNLLKQLEHHNSILASTANYHTTEPKTGDDRKVASAQFTIKYNQISHDAFLYRWHPEEISIASVQNLDVNHDHAADNRGQTSHFDGPEGLLANVVASETRNGLALGAWDMLKVVYNLGADPATGTTWPSILSLKSDLCAGKVPEDDTTMTPQEIKDWQTLLDDLKECPVIPDTTKGYPSMYNCFGQGKDSHCKKFAPYDENVGSDALSAYLLGNAVATEQQFFDTHACPIQAGCMIRPYGSVKAKTIAGKPASQEDSVSGFIQHTEGHMCAPAFWVTTVHSKGNHQNILGGGGIPLYQTDPGIIVAMRTQTFTITIGMDFITRALFPGDFLQSSSKDGFQQQDDFYFVFENTIYYRLDFGATSMRQELFQSYITQHQADVAKISCPGLVSRINWENSDVGSEVFEVNLNLPKHTALSILPPTFNPDYDPRLFASSTQRWIEIRPQPQTFANETLAKTFQSGLTFRCQCLDCDPVPFFPANPVPLTFKDENHAFVADCTEKSCTVPSGATFADPRWNWKPAFSVRPYAIMPPMLLKPKAVPQYEVTYRSQHRAVSTGDDASCSCAGPGGIKFFCSVVPVVDEDVVDPDNKVSDTTRNAFKRFTGRVKASASYITCGYSWVDSGSLNVPDIGLFLGSKQKSKLKDKKNYKVVERNILLDGYAMNDEHIKDHLQGTTGGKPDFTSKILQDRYWFTGNNHPFDPHDPEQPTPYVKNDLDEAQRLYNNSVDWVKSLKVSALTNQSIHAVTHICAFEECLDKTNPDLCKDNGGYQIELFHNTDKHDEATLLCWRRWYYEYSFESSCTRWPYGFVQALEMNSKDREELFPPPTDPPEYLMSYCERFESGEDSRFFFCNNDPFSDNEDKRASFCNPKQNPMGAQYRMDGVIITDHPIDAACSDRLKACLIVPGSTGASSFGAVLNNAATGRYENYTMLRTNFNFLAVVNMFGFLSGEGQSDPSTQKGRKRTPFSIDDDDTKSYTGFKQSDDVFRMFLDLDNAETLEEVKQRCTQFEQNLQNAIPGDGKFCPTGQFQLLGLSNSDHAYRCVDKDWWRAPPLTEREILIRDDGVTLGRACIETDPDCGPLTFETLPSEKSHDSCTRIENGGARLTLDNVVFNQTFCKLKRPELDDRLTPIKFSGRSIAGTRVSMTHVAPTGSLDHAAVMVLGDDTAFFGHHPTIFVDGSVFTIDTSAQYTFAAARAEGVVDLDCGAGATCDIILQQPNQTFQPISFSSNNRLEIIDIGNYTGIFGTSIERRLFSRQVDHSTTGWIFVGVLGIMFVLQVTIIVVSAVDPGLVEAMLTETLYGRILPYRGPVSRIFAYDPKETVTLTKTGPDSYVWNSHYSGQVDKTGTPKTGALVVETHFVTSQRTNDRHTASLFYHLAYDFRIECIRKDGAIPVPNTLLGHHSGVRTVPQTLYDALLNL
jgi:hypothetical protein